MKPLSLGTHTCISTVHLGAVAALLSMALSAHAEVTMPMDAGDALGPKDPVHIQEDLLEVPAQSVTNIQIRPDGSQVTIHIVGDGKLFPEAKMLDNSRLIVDFPAVASALRNSTMRTDHQLLKKIRVGHHADKVRLVFDVLEHPLYSVSQTGREVLVTLQPSEHEAMAKESAVAASLAVPPSDIPSKALFQRSARVSKFV